MTHPVAKATDFRPSPGLRLGYLLYQVIAHFLAPLLVALALLRSRREPMYRRRLHERFGFSRKARPKSVWVFAASLGETRAVSPLLRDLLDRGLDVLLTHSSPAGLLEGQRLFGPEIASGRIMQCYGPLDLALAVRVFLGRHKPRIGLIVESEVWPAQLMGAARCGIPMVIVNGNFTQRAFDRDRRGIGRLRLGFFRAFALALTKSPAHVARYVAAGIPPERVYDVGELKFDLPVNHTQIAAAHKVCAALAAGRRVFMIASSIEAEEDSLCKILDRLQTELSDPPLVLWVPRSPQRFGAVAQRLRSAGYRVSTRSSVLTENFSPSKGASPADVQVLVGDSLGEMDFYYALADLVFVGATLTNMGGHNIIEPLAQEKPVVTGPSIYGISFPAEEARAAGALRVLADAGSLGTEIVCLFKNDVAMTEFQRAARGFNAVHRGAARRSADLLWPLLDG